MAVQENNGNSRSLQNPDFIVENHGSIFLLSPQTNVARAWIDQHITREGFQPYWPTVVIEPGYIADVVAGIQKDGLMAVSR